MAEAQQRCTSAEFAEWIAFNSVEPIGDVRADIQAARVCQLLAAAFGKRGRSPKLSDFMPDWWQERRPREQTPAQMAAVIRAAWAMASGK